jgi:hypothetical protein
VGKAAYLVRYRMLGEVSEILNVLQKQPRWPEAV